MNDQKRRQLEQWRVNPATYLLFKGEERTKKLMIECGITKGVQSSEVSRVTANKTRIDNVSASVQTSFGEPSEGIMRILVGIEKPWFLTSFTAGEYELTGDFREDSIRGEIVIGLDIEGRMHPCPNCGTMCKVHQREERFYSHGRMNGIIVVLKARVPKLRCDVCKGYPQIEVGWARPRVSYTKMLEREAFQLLQDMAVSKTAEYLGLRMWALWDMIQYRVEQGLRSMDLSDVDMIYVDETSSKKGQNYITVICDQRRRIIFLCEGRDSKTMDRFCEWLKAHNGDPDRIGIVSCDLGEAYPAGVRRNFPSATIVYDRFHAVKLIGEALDAVILREMTKNKNIRGLRRKLQKNPKAFTDDEIRRLERTVGDFGELADNYRLKNVFYSLYDYEDRETASHVLDLWLDDVESHGSKEMKVAAKSINSRREGILAWFDNRVSNGFAEGINSLIQTTKKVARGYRNMENFMAMVYLRDGHLDIQFDRGTWASSC